MITDAELTAATNVHTEMEMAAIKAALERQPAARWARASAEVLYNYAAKPFLSRGEAVAILQGLTPPVPCHGDEKIYYLDDYADVVQRFLADGERGTIHTPCRPVELLEWANELGVHLPNEFKCAIDPTRRSDSRPNSNAAQPISLQPDVIQQSKQINLHWQCMAEAAAKKFLVDRKRQPTRKEVARLLASDGVHASIPRIERLTRNTWSPTKRGSKRRVV